ncbi:unnamed protein product, partial [Sphenostylis stenocarpa]
KASSSDCVTCFVQIGILGLRVMFGRGWVINGVTAQYGVWSIKFPMDKLEFEPSLSIYRHFC